MSRDERSGPVRVTLARTESKYPTRQVLPRVESVGIQTPTIGVIGQNFSHAMTRLHDRRARIIDPIRSIFADDTQTMTEHPIASDKQVVGAVGVLAAMAQLDARQPLPPLGWCHDRMGGPDRKSIEGPDLPLILDTVRHRLRLRYLCFIQHLA